ncbi:protein of unknown function [Malonomonas rubra DSM 5091]|uniref:PatA-like N-terminal domain-containing protein n=1 Tax=Malonomonas rubra DSM 5091 TaxID=1122189 RepID=A0A1M6DFR7_MALRU|nr:DUF4388 domain-containing protein [Malonomonas rubra]SHI72187.1 protein of unknown function [Malonomonas rubra DSM 5091]
MGLEGYLEDLGIGDILQIVSLSKKSGTLFLKNGKKGSITFLQGQVVRATSSEYPQTLGQLLKANGLVAEEQIDAALARQKSLDEHKPVGALLVESCQLDPQQVEEVVGRQIEAIVSSFFTWSKGFFSFELGEPQAFGSAALNPFDFMLEKGISSQRLVVKGERLASSGEVVADDGELEKEVAQLESRLDDQSLFLLKGMLAELDNPYIGGGIIMLILRYASEIMNRAIIFDVRDRQLVGLGQFGLDSLSSAADEIVRKMRLTAENGSVFGRVLSEKESLMAPLGGARSERTLIEILGGAPDSVFLAPLVSDGKVVAMLYGDNFPDSGPIRSAQAFELFLSKAGIAMEQALQDV